MADYRIFADSGCDLNDEMLEKADISCIQFTFMFTDDTNIHTNKDMSMKSFYEEIRNGRSAITSGLNVDEYKEAFTPALKAGNDVLYICFSSGLSSTYSHAVLAAKELSEEYPDRKIKIVDSLSASAGYGLLVYMTAEKKRTGATIEEATGYAEDMKHKINLWFTVDDLKYLKKGGRLKSVAVKVASKVGIKPILHMDETGHIIFRYIVRGRKAVYKALLNEFNKRVIDKSAQVFVSNADCKEEIDRAAEEFTRQLGVKFSYIADIGPVIGSHCGPGTYAVFFVGAGR